MTLIALPGADQGCATSWPPLLGTGFLVSTLAALILSINVGLFGFQESIRASFVVESILLESIGAAALLSWTVIVLEAQPKRRWGRYACTESRTRQ
jgi:hypothetical protein